MFSIFISNRIRNFRHATIENRMHFSCYANAFYSNQKHEYFPFLMKTGSNHISNRNTKNVLLIGIEHVSISFLIEKVSNSIHNRSNKKYDNRK